MERGAHCSGREARIMDCSGWRGEEGREGEGRGSINFVTFLGKRQGNSTMNGSMKDNMVTLFRKPC